MVISTKTGTPLDVVEGRVLGAMVGGSVVGASVMGLDVVGGCVVGAMVGGSVVGASVGAMVGGVVGCVGSGSNKGMRYGLEVKACQTLDFCNGVKLHMHASLV